jgi:16S rRNA (adenine1518-N6/adenine1519-N6)-dimethyltransferase
VIFKTKKSLGQNFLVDQNILRLIANSTEIKKNNEIIEIGPGTGNLTEFLLKKNPKKIYLIEKDEKLVNLLKNKFSEKLDIINEDILKFSKKNLLNNESIIFGNLPYNISSQILVKFIINKNKFKFKKLIFMFQKELADRILAKVNSSNYGRLSILANWKFNIKKVIDIKPNSFFPRPKVLSSLLIFYPKIPLISFKNPENLEYITKIFFNQRRKKIKKPINILFKNSLNISEKFKLNLDLRPQNISPEIFYGLAKEYENLRS